MGVLSDIFTEKLNSSSKEVWWNAEESLSLKKDFYAIDIGNFVKQSLIEDDVDTKSIANASEDLNLEPKVIKEFRFPTIDFVGNNLRYDFVYQQKIQRWKGVIIEIQDKSFIAKLDDLNQMESGTYEVAEFDYEEVSPSDMEFLSLGSVFYWNVGLEMRNGQISKKSSIRFQRLVPWNEREYDGAIDNAKYFLEKIAWE